MTDGQREIVLNMLCVVKVMKRITEKPVSYEEHCQAMRDVKAALAFVPEDTMQIWDAWLEFMR